MRFESKVDRWLVVLVMVASLGPLWACVAAFKEGPPLQALGLVAIVALGFSLPVSMFFTTHYTFDGAVLRVRSGPFRWNVPLAAIDSVRPSRSLLSGPALSLDRLRIDYQRGKQILISPADQAAFLRELEARRKRASAP